MIPNFLEELYILSQVLKFLHVSRLKTKKVFGFTTLGVIISDIVNLCVETFKEIQGISREKVCSRAGLFSVPCIFNIINFIVEMLLITQNFFFESIHFTVKLRSFSVIDLP